MMRISNALVVGGGIGGLAAATCLARRGIAVTVLEQAPRFSEIGAGLQVSPNGVAVLRALGLENALKARGAVQGEAVILKDMSTEDTVARLDLNKAPAGQNYYFAHRADLVEILAAAAKRENVSFEMGARVTSYQTGQLGSVTLADGSTRRAELVVAADGIHSKARVLLNGEDSAAFSGQVAWRATVPNTIDHPPQAQVAMGAGRHLVSYPIQNGAFVNLVAVEERAAWAAEGWTQRVDPANLRAAFAQAGRQTQMLLEMVDHVTLWGLHLHPVAATWHGPGLALLGDAAHPTLPFLAQGANMALEDAWVLAAALARPSSQGPAAYQSERETRVRRVIKASEKNAKRYHLKPGPLRTLTHGALRVGSKVAPRRMLGSFDWLYGVDVTVS